MPWRLAAFIALVIASVGGLSHANDTVSLGNEADGKINGVIAWGAGASQPAIGSSPVTIGAVSPGTAKQVVSFTVGRPPALDAAVVWTTGDDPISVDYPPVYEIPIKFWILCAQDDCAGGIPARTKTKLAAFLVWANERLRAERVGVTLLRADGDDWISDLTRNDELGVDFPRDFKIYDVGNATPNDCDGLPSTSRNIRKVGALNVYMVRTVDGDPRTSDSCGTDDSAVIGYAALKGTILHELGHDLSLGHTDSQDWYAAVGGKKNLMAKSSTQRKYLTEGQVFRMHFATTSGLNHDLSSSLPPSLPPNRTARDCEGSPQADLPCPPEETLIWADP